MSTVLICLQDWFDSDIHSSSCEESDFGGSDADSDAELQIFVAHKYSYGKK